MYDAKKIRQDFPVLSRKVYGKPLVYLDNAATSQKPKAVINALVDYYEQRNANIHRGVHALSMEATDMYEGARAKVAKFINAPADETIIWTRGTTESLNLIAYAWGLNNVRKGDEILVTGMEHHSNLVPWQFVAGKTGATLRHIPVMEAGTLDLKDLDMLLNKRTKLFAFTMMSNVLGTITPAKMLIDKAHAVGATVVLDAAQSAPHMPIDVQALDADFLAFSAHKMLGPTGIGVLYGKKALLEEMEPFQFGGDMIEAVYMDHATWNTLPYKFEAGTPNIADAIAFGAAIDYLDKLGMKNVREHEKQLTEHALDKFRTLEGVHTFGPVDLAQRGGVVSFSTEGIHPHDIGTFLDREGVAIRTGHHCAMPLMGRLGVPATARASFYLYNTEEEIDFLVDSIRRCQAYFSRAGRTAR